MPWLTGSEAWAAKAFAIGLENRDQSQAQQSEGSSRSVGWASEAMAKASQCAIQGVAAVEERQYRTAANTKAFEGAANAEVASRGDEALFERCDRFRGAASLNVHIGKIQV